MGSQDLETVVSVGSDGDLSNHENLLGETHSGDHVQRGKGVGLVGQAQKRYFGPGKLQKRRAGDGMKATEEHQSVSWKTWVVE